MLALKVFAAEAAAAKLKKVLTVKNLRTLLLYFGMKKKEIGSMKVSEMRDCYKKLKDDNTPKKKNTKNGLKLKKLAELTKAMSDDVQLSDTALLHWKRITNGRSRSRCWLPC